MSRDKIPSETIMKVVTDSKRRCCLCVGLENDYSIKLGQIAHLDKNNSNNKLENLAWLCLDHHSSYDSKTSQHKNFTIDEVKFYRTRLYNPLKALDDIKKGLYKFQIFDETKPGYLICNGTTQYIKIEKLHYFSINKFIIEIDFALVDRRYSGVLLSLENGLKSSAYYVFYTSIEEKEFANEIQLIRVDKNLEDKPNVLISFNIEDKLWQNLKLKFDLEKIYFEIGKNKGFVKNIDSFFTLDNVLITAKKINEKVRISFPLGISYFKIYDLENKKLINELIFYYGKDHYLKYSKNDNTMIVGSPTYNE